MTQHNWSEPAYKPQRPLRLPIEVLPKEIAQYVKAISTQFQIDAGFVLLVLLSVIATATRGKVLVRVRDKWCESLSLYTAPLLPSGSRKSATMATISRPLSDLQKELQAAALPKFLEQESNQRIAQQKLAKAEKAYADESTPRNEAALRNAQETALLAHVEAMPRFLIDDVTPEALAAHLAAQGSAGLLTTEGGVLANFTGDRYSNGTANLNVLLQAHAGEPIRVTRKGSLPVEVTDPHLVICTAGQPDLVREMNLSAEMRNRGLHSRFIFLFPESNLGDRELRPPTAPAHLDEMWDARVRAIALNTSKRELHLDAGAAAILFEVEKHAEMRCGQQDTDWQSGWFSKLSGTVTRISALFALFQDSDTNTVDAESMRAAASLVNWLEWHAMAADAARVPPRKENLLKQMRRWDGTPAHESRTFSTRDIHQAMRGRKWVQVGGVEVVEQTLQELVTDGWIRKLPQAYKDGRPSQLWEWHPLLLHYWEQQTKGR